MKDNKYLQTLIIALKKQSKTEKVKIWSRIAHDLEKTNKNSRVINVFKINKYAKENETVVVPGKVLGSGDIERKINVAAFKFSNQAKEKIIGAKGNAIDLYTLMKTNPKGKLVRILG